MDVFSTAHAFQRDRRGFSLIELLVVIAIIALLMSILLPAFAEARRTARTSVCQTNFQQIGRAHFSYAADCKDRIGMFGGKGIFTHSGATPQGYNGDVDIEAAYAQAAEIVAKNSTKLPNEEFISPGGGTDIHALTEEYSHLALADYMGQRLPLPSTVCPEDKPRRDWQQRIGTDPVTSRLKILSSPYLPTRSWNGVNGQWLPYSSSYQLLPSSWLKDYSPQDSSSGSEVLSFRQGKYHNLYSWNKGERIGGRRLDEVTFPAQKVAIADSQQRHFGKVIFYAYLDARQPLLFWDGSVSIRRTRDANPGWDRLSPAGKGATKLKYAADSGYEPAPPAKYAYSWDAYYIDELPAAYYKWTRGGLKGIDYGGGEIDTGQKK